MDASNFGLRLKELREQAGLTQPQLAERAALSKAGVADLEQGRREPTWATVVALSQALAVTPNDFLQEPAARPAAGPGRPRKPTVEAVPPAENPKPKTAHKRKGM